MLKEDDPVALLAEIFRSQELFIKRLSGTVTGPPSARRNRLWSQ